MKKLITLFIALSLFSCNDGDFDIPIFEFSNTVNSCGEYILYIKNSTSTEVLVLTLNTTHIGTELSDETYDVSSSLNVNYRIFEEAIGATYFCQDIPPSIPKVLKELTAESGIINISTSEVLTDDILTGYEYAITISELLFNENNERIFIENLDFGIFKVNL